MNLQITTIPVADLKPWPGNARQGDVGAIVESLQHHGQYRPLVVQASTGQVIAGNHTLQAARELGWQDIAVTMLDVDDDQAQRINIVDNRTQDLATNDDYALAQLLRDLAATEDGLAGTGYDGDDLDDLLTELDAGENRAGQDTDPGEPPEEPRTKPGDVWVLGDHRLVCGDCTDQLVAAAVTGGASMDLVVTDPPYGVSYASIGRTGKQHAPIANDSLSEEETRDLFADALSIAGLKPGGTFYATVPAGPLLRWFMEATERGLGDGALRQVLVWVKDNLVMGRGDYHYRHEPILYGWAPGAAHYFVDDRKQDSVWEIARPKRSDEHPTMKPIGLFERAISNSSTRGQCVYDPFGGSGTTLIACENLGRKARLVELDPGYCDVIVDRWERHTGNTAVLEEPDDG